MLNKTGAGTQHPIRSYWMLRSSPQSYNNSKHQSKLQGKHNNSEQQYKRYKANSTATAACPP